MPTLRLALLYQKKKMYSQCKVKELVETIKTHVHSIMKAEEIERHFWPDQSLQRTAACQHEIAAFLDNCLE